MLVDCRTLTVLHAKKLSDNRERLVRPRGRSLLYRAIVEAGSASHVPDKASRKDPPSPPKYKTVPRRYGQTPRHDPRAAPSRDCPCMKLHIVVTASRP